MTKIFSMVLLLVIVGCASTGTGFTNTEVLVQKTYIVRIAPDALKTLPLLPEKIQNPKTATNEEVASWINRTEEYVTSLEDLLKTLVIFYEAPVTPTEAAIANSKLPQSKPSSNPR